MYRPPERKAACPEERKRRTGRRHSLAPTTGSRGVFSPLSWPNPPHSESVMSDVWRRLFKDYDDGRVSRRELMQILAGAALIAPVRAAIGQGGGAPPARDTSGGRGRRVLAPQDTMPAPAPFEPTGW